MRKTACTSLSSWIRENTIREKSVKPQYFDVKTDHISYLPPTGELVENSTDMDSHPKGGPLSQLNLRCAIKCIDAVLLYPLVKLAFYKNTSIKWNYFLIFICKTILTVILTPWQVNPESGHLRFFCKFLLQRPKV